MNPINKQEFTPVPVVNVWLPLALPSFIKLHFEIKPLLMAVFGLLTFASLANRKRYIDGVDAVTV